MSEQSRVLAGRYRVDEVIGRGGMATVYRGYDVTLGRPIAIKVLDKQLARDNVFRTRFRMEAQAASRMSNPTIVRVYDAGEERAENGDAIPFIVMELVSGRTLKEVIAEGPVPVPEAMRYVDGILEALEYSHRAGVIHRDIKPGNVMITDDKRVKVMDFGIARAVSDSSSTVAETTSIIGTAAYFSPEQAKGEPVDARTDLYSTGVVLYELLAGRQPFRGDTAVAVAYQHVSETPTPPSDAVATVPRALDAVVLRALAKDPFNRYPDASSFRAAIAGANEGRTPTKRQLDSLTNELYGANPRAAAETARSLRQLSSDTTMTRTQQGPPVAWIWSGVAVLAVLIVSVVFWVVSFSNTNAEPTALKVPDVVNEAYSKAEGTLKEAGFEVTKVDGYSDTIAEGNVMSTDPEAGSPYEEGDAISVTVSLGEKLAAVPALVGTADAAARKAITDAGLKVGEVTRVNDPDAAAGTVLSASKEEGAELQVGSVVDLVVATGKVSVIDLSGFPLESAKSQLEDLKLVAVEAQDPSCPTAPKPTVHSQSALGDVDIKAQITLYVCSGK